MCIRLCAAGLASGANDAVEMNYVGCSYSETDFSADKAYAGGSVGASAKMAKQHAISKRKRFVAISRHHADGHAFAFNTWAKT